MKVESVSPWTGEVIYEADFYTEQQVVKTVEDLDLVFKKWSALKVSDRHQYVQKFIELLKLNKDQIADLITTSMGKPLAQSVAEVKKCIDVIEQVLKMDLKFLEQKEIPSNYRISYQRPKPLGIILTIMPWNYPLWQALRMIIPNILAGNAILLKHSEITTQVGNVLEKLFKEAGDLSPVRNTLFEHSVTEKVLNHHCVQGVSLTGSTTAGITVARLAGQNMKKGVFELGGSDPYVVLSDADLTLAAKMISQSRLQNTGQSCVAAKRALVPQNQLSEFVELMKTEWKTYQYGEPKAAKTNLGPLAAYKFKSAYEKMTEEMLSAKAGEILFKHQSVSRNSKTASFDALIVQAHDVKWFQEKEFFAPVMVIFPYETEAEALQIANSTIYGLGGAVFSKDEEKAIQFAQKMDSGMIAINDMIKSELNIPFGGFKKSGLGREMGPEGFIEFTAPQVVSLK